MDVALVVAEVEEEGTLVVAVDLAATALPVAITEAVDEAMLELLRHSMPDVATDVTRATPVSCESRLYYSDAAYDRVKKCRKTHERPAYLSG